jgi:hypothetical protein
MGDFHLSRPDRMTPSFPSRRVKKSPSPDAEIAGAYSNMPGVLICCADDNAVAGPLGNQEIGY